LVHSGFAIQEWVDLSPHIDEKRFPAPYGYCIQHAGKTLFAASKMLGVSEVFSTSRRNDVSDGKFHFA